MSCQGFQVIDSRSILLNVKKCPLTSKPKTHVFATLRLAFVSGLLLRLGFG